jgi:sugar phosphate isomerase/epimerase
MPWLFLALVVACCGCRKKTSVGGSSAALLQIRPAVCLASLKQPFKVALHTAARLGVRAIEIDARREVRPAEMSQTGLRHLRKQMADLNLSVAAVTFQTRGSYYDLDGLDQRVDATKQALKLAYDLGTNVVVNQIGRIPEDAESIHFQTLQQSLTDLGRTGQRVGALLAARTGTESGETMLQLIQAIPAGSIAVDLDPGNLIIHGFSADEAARKLSPFIWHVHARDGVQDLARGRGIETPLGRGTADFPNLLGILEEQRYRGYLTVQRDSSDDPILEISNAIEYLQKLV